MATEQTAPTTSFVSVQSSSSRGWKHCTENIVLSDDMTNLFVLATGDAQNVHLSDDAARALPFGLKGKIMHGALVRDIAVNNLIQRSLSSLFGIGTTHSAIDRGGSYTTHSPVYPGESIYARYDTSGRLRREGTSLMTVRYAVYVVRDEVETMVLEGEQKAVLVFNRTKEADKS